MALPTCFRQRTELLTLGKRGQYSWTCLQCRYFPCTHRRAGPVHFSTGSTSVICFASTTTRAFAPALLPPPSKPDIYTASTPHATYSARYPTNSTTGSDPESAYTHLFLGPAHHRGYELHDRAFRCNVYPARNH